MVREGDRYHLVITMRPFCGGEEAHLAEPDNVSSPGIALCSSPDLKAWKFETWLVKSSELPADCPYKHRFWAPEIHKIAEKFYLFSVRSNGTWGARPDRGERRAMEPKLPSLYRNEGPELVLHLQGRQY